MAAWLLHGAEAEQVPDGAGFKDTIQPRQLQYLLDLVPGIHQLKHDRVRTSPFPQAQQDAQAARIDAVNLS